MGQGQTSSRNGGHRSRGSIDTRDPDNEEDIGQTSQGSAEDLGVDVPSNDDDAEPKLKILIQSEAFSFSEEENDWVYDHTKIILQKGEDYFAAKVEHRETENLDPDSLDITHIPREHYCPKFKDGITKAPEPLPADTYIKRPCLLHWEPDDKDPEDTANVVLQEAEICEILKEHPHPNIVRYFGCLVEDDRISGLCFAKCDSELSKKVENASDDQKYLYFEGVDEGVDHLHGLGLIHNDINPANIMMDGETPVIIDFDSCRPEGEKLGSKTGTPDWFMEEAKFAALENDYYSLLILRDYIFSGGKKP